MLWSFPYDFEQMPTSKGQHQNLKVIYRALEELWSEIKEVVKVEHEKRQPKTKKQKKQTGCQIKQWKLPIRGKPIQERQKSQEGTCLRNLRELFEETKSSTAKY